MMKPSILAPSFSKVSLVTASLYYSLLISSSSTQPSEALKLLGFTNSFQTSQATFFHNFSLNHRNTIMSKSCKGDNVDTDSMIENPLQSLDLPPLILGSNSFTRKLILQEMKIPFMLKVKPIDEYEIGIRENESYAKDLVLTLAKAKADALVKGIVECNNVQSTNNSIDNSDDKFNLQLPNYSASTEYIVLTADQVVTCNNDILEKPQSIEQAHTFIEQYAHNTPQTVGSVVITHLPSMKQVSEVDISTIHFKPSIGKDSKELVQRLLDDGAPILSCAGGLMVEHPLVQDYIEKIDGSVDGVMGLSKSVVLKLLREIKDLINNNN